MAKAEKIEALEEDLEAVVLGCGPKKRKREGRTRTMDWRKSCSIGRILDHLVGGEIIGVTERHPGRDDEEVFGILVRVGGRKKVVWVSADEDGREPGFLEIEDIWKGEDECSPRGERLTVS